MHAAHPILPGFYPDPSICRVGGDFYLVNSSFEYFPGVPLWHSRDLREWRQLGHVLDRPSQLPLPTGTKPSDGIYAPTIRHHAGRFYMVTTHMPGLGNFLVHATDPRGPWSEPVMIAQRGIDPSLFFDSDGRCFFTSNGTFWAPVRGAYQCEINPLTGEQLTPSRFLWAGTGGAYPEAPHLFKRGEFYYLMLAEGGTSECHMVTVARSRDPYGPFEPCPHNPILTHRSLMGPVQATGHADFVEDADGNWWAVFLGYRYSEYAFHPLGRETFLAPVTWTADHWPLINGGLPLVPTDTTPGWALPPAPPPPPPDFSAALVRDDFDSPHLGLDWVFVRNPEPSAVSLAERPGSLSVACLPASPDDLASFAGVVRRQRHFVFRASALLDFAPASASEEAGLVVLMDHLHHYEIALTLRDSIPSLVVRRRIGTLVAEVACAPAPEGPVQLLLQSDRQHYRFGFRHGDADHWLASGEVRYLCTEVAGGYNGVMLGPYATARGRTGSANRARFDWFDYAPAA
jgi:alpha-N-arabinofuranosidase